MLQKICYSFASRSRPEKFFACLDNIREMSDGPDYFVAAKLDTSDKSDYDRLNEYPEVKIFRGYSKNKVHAINRDLEGLEFDILCNHSDDMWLIKKGFDNIIREAFTEDDLFLHFPDQAAGERLCTYSIMDRKYFDRTGTIYNPAYQSLWCDNEAQAVAIKLGRYKFINEKILEHRHPANGHGKGDYLLKHSESFYLIDKKTFDRRVAVNFGL